MRRPWRPADGDGRWHRARGALRLPGRDAAADVRAAARRCPPEPGQLRLRTNQEIYWDRLAVAFAEPCPEVRGTAACCWRRPRLADDRLCAADHLAQRRPHYDYERRTPFWDARIHGG